MDRRSFLSTALALAPTGAFAFAPGALRSSPSATDVYGLKAGEWIWEPQLAPQGPMAIYVNLTAQRALVYRNGIIIGATTVSSGKPGHLTPTGVFTILQKDAKHHSTKYNNASMPFTERLTWDGVALHAGGLPGYPSSHGCVHLPLKFSELLFGQTSLGMTVVITATTPEPRTIVAPNLLTAAKPDANTPSERLVAGEEFSWHPELSPTGPVSIVVSTADQRSLVLRNGVIIGRSRITYPPGRIVGMQALQFKGVDSKGANQWFYIGLPGDDPLAGKPVPPDWRKGVVIPKEYLADVHSIITVGTTMLLTDQSVVDTGAPVTVIATS